jgi:hypothetical protein
LCACPADAEFKAAIRSVSDECSTDIDIHKQFVDKYEAKLIQAKADLQLRQRQFEQYEMLLNDTESSYVERVAAMDIVTANQQPTMSQRMTHRWSHGIAPVDPMPVRAMQVRPMQDRPMQVHTGHTKKYKYYIIFIFFGPRHRRKERDWLGGLWGGGRR